MKQLIFGLGIIGLSFTALQASAQTQRYCVIDSKYILEKLPEYTKAQEQLDKESKEWEKEIDQRMQAIDQMYKSYQAERPMLSEDVRRKREDEIVAKEKEAKDLQKKYFGFEGELFKRRMTLVKPIQDKVFNAVQSYAQQRSYEIVYDKSGGVTIFYADPKIDKSEDILKLIK